MGLHCEAGGGECPAYALDRFLRLYWNTLWAFTMLIFKLNHMAISTSYGQFHPGLNPQFNSPSNTNARLRLSSGKACYELTWLTASPRSKPHYAFAITRRNSPAVTTEPRLIHNDVATFFDHSSTHRLDGARYSYE